MADVVDGSEASPAKTDAVPERNNDLVTDKHDLDLQENGVKSQNADTAPTNDDTSAEDLELKSKETADSEDGGDTAREVDPLLDGRHDHTDTPGLDICPDELRTQDASGHGDSNRSLPQDGLLHTDSDPRLCLTDTGATYRTNGSSESLGPESSVSEDDSCQGNGKVPNEADSTDVLFDSMESVQVVDPKAVSFFKLFRYADGVDAVLMLFGTLGALLAGTALQVNFLVYGRVIDLMLREATSASLNSTNTTSAPFDRDALFVEMKSNIKWFATLGACIIAFAFFEMSFWMWSAERQTRRMRQALFWSVLSKDQAWYDRHHVGELTAMLTDDIQSIQNGISDKFSKTLEWLTTFVVGYIIGFIRGWKLTLVILSVSPLLGLAVALLTQVTRKLTAQEVKCYGAAGAVAEEVLAAVRTVVAYGEEEKEVNRYGKNLESAREAGCRKAMLSGIIQGAVYLVIFCTFALAFWYGTKLVGYGEYTGGEILQIFFGVLQGTTAIGHAVPSFETIAVARSAAAKVFDIIDHVPSIDSSSEDGERPEKCRGSITFSNVHFSFPTRRSVKILRGLSFSVHVGQTVGLVGASGSGKSTALQLIQRFYDPDSGQITLDDRPLRSLNVEWLRRQIGVVSQEPILFAKTIADNIRLGNLEATQSEIIQAAREANAHDFISALPKKYETLIGERGAQLSGGQKQRIAIARALVRNPKILLLDEATSALDTQSEATVQTALDKASKGRTTLVIAHRLSTIKNADLILSLKDGQIIEKGTHRELMSLRGQYYQLVSSQGRVLREASVDSIDGPLFAEEVLKPASDRAKSFRRLDSTVSFRRFGTVRASGRESKLFRSMSVMSQREEEKEATKLPAPSMRRLLHLNRSQAGRMVVGCLGAVFVGAAIPLFSVVISEVLGNFATPDFAKMMEQTKILSIIFVGIGVGSGLGCFLQNYFFGIAGEHLTLKLRKMTFAAMLKQEIGWFDNQVNQVGALTSRLANDASRIKGAAGQQFGILVQAAANMGASIVIAFIFGPKLAGVIFCFIPLMFISGIVQGKLIQDSTKGSMDELDNCAQVASEAIDNIHTVSALTRERHFEQMYCSKLRSIYRQSKKNAFVFGTFYAFSQSIIYFAYAATFGYGTVLIENGEIEFYNVFRVFACLIFGSMSLGRALSWMPDYSKAKIAAAKVFNLLDREPLIQSMPDGCNTPAKCEGSISFLNITFRYPMRQDVKVLSGFSLTVLPGQTVALVGASGCGKSTTMQLLERFYDPDHGCVCLDGQNLVALSLPWLRSQVGLVSQEPILFDLTIRDNIAYGTQDPSMEDVIQAAREANIHSFIEGLPMGYDTNVGEKGTQLSGGQKQRIAIARALLRKPRILLLDEATSALDTESEKVVQAALDRAREGRTCLVIAHRLSTIQNADVIVLIHCGQVVEYGSHTELLDRHGFYYELHKAQRRSRRLRKTLS